MDPNILSSTKKMRLIQLNNLPLELGLTSIDIRRLVTEFMMKNYLNDTSNTNPILNCEISEKERSANLELSSVEETNRLCKLDKIHIFNNECKIIRLGDTLYGGTMNLANLVS